MVEGGFLDIDIKLIGPDGKVVYEQERESNGRFTFPAHMDGVFTYCFGNKMSTMTPKIVMFSMDLGEASKKEGVDGEGKHASNQGQGVLRAGLCSTRIFRDDLTLTHVHPGDSTLTQLNTLLFLIDSTPTQLEFQIC